ncbi:hypothetical protein C4D60_Mb10t09760 [Musa balbisiana]|uniref:BZIP domain-containing protein n=1 Tax=Musa balbisiana TaxID=52838 RepID=A0A4S8IW07_MUSBA|nr:hypothetical protein C4D60_Mb10t09760 [Musa balbisiana]
MSPILSEILLSGFMINSTLRRRTHLVQSFSVVFLYWFYKTSVYIVLLGLMASPSATSSGSSRIGQSQSEEDLQALMNQRKQKRMLSNRESARRSRMRKQKHLDDLTAQVSQLRKENGQILTALSVTTQHYVGVEAENSVLRAQMMELTATLQSLSQILHNMRGIGSAIGDLVQPSDSFVRPWNLMDANQPMTMASADTSQLYC